MMIPTVHMNGTGSKALLEELAAAHDALTTAYDVLRQVTVHGRDYYPQGPAVYPQARHEMDARLAALAQIEKDVLTMHVAIQQQVKVTSTLEQNRRICGFCQVLQTTNPGEWCDAHQDAR